MTSTEQYRGEAVDVFNGNDGPEIQIAGQDGVAKLWTSGSTYTVDQARTVYRELGEALASLPDDRRPEDIPTATVLLQDEGDVSAHVGTEIHGDARGLAFIGLDGRASAYVSRAQALQLGAQLIAHATR